jgi:hypothetical protein
MARRHHRRRRRRSHPSTSFCELKSRAEFDNQLDKGRSHSVAQNRAENVLKMCLRYGR